ncbi:nodulation protein NoeA [soil metagenome]
MRSDLRLASSFRDPSGFVYREDGRIRRFVAPEYAPTLDLLVSCGLYDKLVAAKILIAHKEIDGADRIIEPELVETISYPYEWCFGQYKAAALTTLRLQRAAINHGLSLKDASAFNIQFHEGNPALIDTLSFEPYIEGGPWKAYHQFCSHFLAPLAVMSHVDIRLGKLMAEYIGGFPIDLASKLLPGTTKLNSGLAMHLHLHAKMSGKGGSDKREAKVSKVALMGIVESLQKTIEKLDWNPEGTVWADYYSETNYSDDAMLAKRDLVGKYIRQVNPEVVWDLGANSGEFSNIAAETARHVVAWDFDEAAVEKNFRDPKRSKSVLPLIVDLTNPTPGLGWAGKERDSFMERANPDCVLALALVHHLAIANNVPLEEIGRFLGTLSKNLIIEFVPKSDSQVKRLLSTREDIYVDYNESGFASAFEKTFEIVNRESVRGTDRTLFLLRKRA